MRKLNQRQEVIAYGFTYGQIEVIKMQFYRFNHSYEEIARHYKTRKDTIHKLIVSVQFADIQPLGGYPS
jgi:predicted DNA-binding protein YlxM (UPF0122 family)